MESICTGGFVENNVAGGSNYVICEKCPYSLRKIPLFPLLELQTLACLEGGGPRVVVNTAAFHARVRGSVPGLGGLKETKNVSSPSTCESQYCGEPP